MGVTCISLALSNFLRNKLGKKTAYIELNATNQIRALSPKKDTSFFSYLKIDFFPCTTITSLPEILQLNYDYFILDMGVLNTYTAKEFSKCEKQFLVCSLCKWKYHQTKEKIVKLLQQTNIHQENVIILDNMREKKSIFNTFFFLSMNRILIPFIPNPFQLEPSLFKVFHQILERN